MIWVWVGIAVVLVAAGALVPVLSGRDNRLRSNDEAVAARSRYNQLGLYVEDGVEQLDDERAMALLRTARERYNTTGATLARASTEEDFLLALGIAEEGLAAVAEAYGLIGRTGPKIRKQKRHK